MTAHFIDRTVHSHYHQQFFNQFLEIDFAVFHPKVVVVNNYVRKWQLLTLRFLNL